MNKNHNETSSEFRIAAEYFFFLICMAPVLDFPKKKKNNKEKKKIQTKTELSAFPFLNKNLEKKMFFRRIDHSKTKGRHSRGLADVWGYIDDVDLI